MWKELLKNQVLKGVGRTLSFETKITPIRRGVGKMGNLSMVTYDYADRGIDSDIDIDWGRVIIQWSMTIEEYTDGLELNAPQVQKVMVDVNSIEDIGEEVENLAGSLELETTENIEVEDLDRVVMGSLIMPDADIEIGRKDGEFYIKSVNISW